MARPFDFNDLITGFSVNQLSQLFNLDRRTVSERLRDTPPSGTRSQHPVWKIKDAAPLLLEGYMYSGQVDERAKLQRADKEKDYWDAMLKQQKFLENEKDLWRTDKNIEVFASTFKQFREAVTVFSDRMEHEADLPDKQVDLVKQFCDSLLSDARERLLQMDTGEDDVPGMSTAESLRADNRAAMDELGLL